VQPLWRSLEEVMRHAVTGFAHLVTEYSAERPS
jgi:hypothetical protein